MSLAGNFPPLAISLENQVVQVIRSGMQPAPDVMPWTMFWLQEAIGAHTRVRSHWTETPPICQGDPWSTKRFLRLMRSLLHHDVEYCGTMIQDANISHSISFRSSSRTSKSQSSQTSSQRTIIYDTISSNIQCPPTPEQPATPTPSPTPKANSTLVNLAMTP
jgi:hypothetical protein